MPKKQTNKEKKELEKLRKDILELRENAEKNYHWELLKKWLFFISSSGLAFLGFLIWEILEHFKILPVVQPIEPSKIEEISPVIFQAIVTINGLIIGFVPLISFFFVREVRERERDYEKDWEEEQKGSRDEKLGLINTYYNLLLMLWHNVRSGVLRYTQTFVVVSMFLEVYLVLSYAVTIGYGMAGLCVVISMIFLLVIVTGLLPLINIALYQPALRVVRYIIPEREIWRIEAED